MTLSRTFIAALSFAVFGAAVAVAEQNNDALQQRLDRLGLQPGETVDRIQNYRVDGWNYLDDRHIMIFAGPSRRFLIGLMSNCIGLSSAQRIGFTTTATQLTRFDRLVVRGPGRMQQTCPISEMRELNPIKEKE